MGRRRRRLRKSRLSRELLRLEVSLRLGTGEVWRVRGRVRDERIRCTAGASRSLSRCRNPSMEGSGLCWKHGGGDWALQYEGARRRLEEDVAEYLEARAMLMAARSDDRHPPLT